MMTNLRIIFTPMIIKAIDCPVIFDIRISLKYCWQMGPSYIKFPFNPYS